ncbi:MAG TPA: penicillin-binding protein 2 [Acidimicrobiales bacterium]
MAKDGRGLRLGVLGIVAVSLFATLFARLWYLQMMSPERLDQQVQTSRIRTVQLAPMRGRIFDRNGMVMADNRRILSVTIDRAEIRSAAKRKILFTRLSGPLQTPVEDLEARYTDVQYDPYLPLPLADDVPETTAIYLGERREDYPGVEVSEGWQRVYRYAPLASHIVGYMGAIPADSAKLYRTKGYKLNERVGKAGIEEEYEGQLRGKPGEITYEVDARNRIIREVSRRDPVPGNDIVLSIDLQLQQYAEQTLQQGLREARTRCPFDSLTQSCGGPAFAAPAGSTVVEDPRNGQVLAMATYPTFDNRWFVEGISNKKIQELYPDADKQAPFVNRALSSPFQMGSTFKLVSTVAGLQSGIITPGSPYNDQGRYQIPNCDVAKFKCIFKNAGLARGSGTISLATALTVSSDTYFYRIGAELQLAQNPTLQNVARQFGYGSDTGIDLPAEISGTVPDAALKKRLSERNPPVISPDEGRGYFVGDNVLFAIGQGLVSATPLQLTNAYATFANGGNRMRPMMALGVVKPGTPDLNPGDGGRVNPYLFDWIQKFQPEVKAQVTINPDWWTTMNKGFTGVVTSRRPFGTAARTFEDYNYRAMPIAGKTGTAQDASQEGSKDDSLFAAYGPTGGPGTAQWAVGTVIEDAGFGAWAAAPVAKCIFAALGDPSRMAPLVQSDPLDKTATTPTSVGDMPNSSCLAINDARARAD